MRGISAAGSMSQDVGQSTMTETAVRLILLGIAGVVLPAAYLATCFWLSRQQAWWFAYLAYFFLFGTVGGWTFAFAMSPSGLTATSIVFLVTAALVACLASSVILALKRKKGRAERIAMLGGFLYPGLLVLMVLIGFLVDRASK
jgi:mannose/fructose/N-acetylgalactosamine-specific phosphotransferase system component IID